jgi:hypothetical protein
MGQLNDLERARSEFLFVLHDSDEGLTDLQFDRVHREILIWSLIEQVPCVVTRTPTGFIVSIYHFPLAAKDYGLRLQFHLTLGILREFMSEGISFNDVGRTQIPE